MGLSSVRVLYIFLFFLFSCAQLSSKKSDKLSILQGVTNSREVEFSIVADNSKKLTFELRNIEGEIISPDEVKVVTRSTSNFSVHKVLFTRDPQKEYNLFVLSGGKQIDQRLIGKGQRENAKLKLAVASGFNDQYPQNFKIWDTILLKNPEYLLLVGDNVFTDAASAETEQVTDPDIIWERYTDMRFKNPLFFKEKLIPIHAIWDDHDYGVKTGNENFSHKKESREIFETFFAQDMGSENWTKAQGIGGLLNLGDFNLYFLDGRSFRSEQADGKHLGLDQSAWFYSKLREEGTPSLIIKGDQFFGGYHRFDSFEGSHPQDFTEFVAELKKITTPFVFLSGDRPLSEIMQFPRSLFGRPSFEITSGPIGAMPMTEEDHNPWRVVSEKGQLNFVMIDSLALDDHWFMDVESYGENGELFFRRELAVFIKDLQNNLNEIRKRRSGKRRYRKIQPRRRRR